MTPVGRMELVSRDTQSLAQVLITDDNSEYDNTHGTHDKIALHILPPHLFLKIMGVSLEHPRLLF